MGCLSFVCQQSPKLTVHPNPGLLYPNLPYIVDQRDGKTVKMTEHLPIIRYLARKHGLYPKTEEELIVAEQTESFMFDIRFRFYRVAYDDKTYEESKAEWLEVTRKKLPYLNDLLGKHEYVTGSLSYVDILLYDFSLLIGAFEPALLQENPNLARHLKTIDSLPQIQNYKAGKGKGACRSKGFRPF